MCGIGWVLMGHAHTLTELYCYYAIAGIGAAFVYSGSMATGLKWFPDKRGLASGIIAAGYGSGSAIFIPIIAAIIRQHDYQRAFLYTGIGQGLIIFLAAQVLRKPGPEVSQWKSSGSCLHRACAATLNISLPGKCCARRISTRSTE